MHTALVLKLVRDRSLWEVVMSEESPAETPAPLPSLALGHAASD